MTLTQAKNVVSAIIDAGYDVTLHLSAGNWTVRARASSLSIPVATANRLAISQGVIGLISEIEYS